MLRKLASILFVPAEWLIYLLSNLSPRDSKLLVFGVHTNVYAGNVKALFESSSEGFDKVFIAHSRSLVEHLRKRGLQTYWRYSPGGVFYCLRAGYYVYSSYPSDINFWLSGGARLINVWHGTPLKVIERDITKGRYSYRNKFSFVYRLLAPYLLKSPDALLVSSPYEEQCFRSAFALKNHRFVKAYPPRLQKLEKLRTQKSGSRTILYVPTWRDDHSFDISDHLDLQSLSERLQGTGLKFLVKRHPSDMSPGLQSNLLNVVELDKNEDVYKYLCQAELLVTDYSSMIFEALYADIPAVLFMPDLSHYQTTSRGFYTDIDNLPACVALDQASLEDKMEDYLDQRNARMKNAEMFSPYPFKPDLLEELIECANQ